MSGTNYWRDLSLFELEILAYACRAKSIREAARRSRLQPAHVSKVIRRVEAKLGLTLLKRTTQGVQLTPELVRILPMIESVLDLAERLPDKPQSIRKASRLHGIATPSFLQQNLIFPALSKVSRSCPDIRYRFLEPSPSELVSQGLQGAFDLAFHTDALQWTPIWQSHRLGSIEYALYARAGHPLASGPAVAEKEVLGYPFVVPAYWQEQRLSASVDYCPVPLRSRICGHETMTASAGLRLIQENDELCFVPAILGHEWEAQGRIRRIRVKEWPAIRRELFLSVHTQKVSQSVLKAWKSAVESVSKSYSTAQS